MERGLRKNERGSRKEGRRGERERVRERGGGKEKIWEI